MQIWSYYKHNSRVGRRCCCRTAVQFSCNWLLCAGWPVCDARNGTGPFAWRPHHFWGPHILLRNRQKGLLPRGTHTSATCSYLEWDSSSSRTSILFLSPILILFFYQRLNFPNRYKCNIEARSRNKLCGGKAISITYSKYVTVILVVQHAKRMRGILLSFVALFGCTKFFHTIS
jgi:hypothetical protein